MEKLTDSQRFWGRVQITDGDGCWIWLGGRARRGYGAFVVKGRQVVASRFAYEDKIGPIPPGLFVLHRCDNPPCVRPDHLFVGTQKQNLADAIAKGRMQTGERHWMKRMPERIARGARAGGSKSPEKRRGSLNPQAKLSEEDVAEIRRLREQGVRGVDIAAQFGISKAQVSRIGTGKRWQHL